MFSAYSLPVAVLQISPEETIFEWLYVSTSPIAEEIKPKNILSLRTVSGDSDWRPLGIVSLSLCGTLNFRSKSIL